MNICYINIPGVLIFENPPERSKKQVPGNKISRVNFFSHPTEQLIPEILTFESEFVILIIGVENRNFPY